MKKVIKAVILWLSLIWPLYLLRFSLAGIPFNLLEIFVVATFFMYFAQNFFEILKGAKEKLFTSFPFKKFYFWAVLSFVLAVILSIIIVPQHLQLMDGNTWFESRKVALGILKGWIIIPLIYFYLLKENIKSYKDIFQVVYSYIFSALPLVLWGLYQFITKDFITLDGRVSGPFINANYLALYLGPALIALVIMLVFQFSGIFSEFKTSRNKKLLSLIHLLLAFLYGFILVATHSYASLIAVFLSLIIFSGFFYKISKDFQKIELKKYLRKIFGLFSLLLIFVAIFSALFFMNTEKWQKFFDFSHRGSSSVRLEVYKIASELVKTHPFLGIGLGQFEAQYNLNAVKILGHEPYEWVMIHPHNTFLAVWLNLGLFGLIFFVALIFYCFRQYFRDYSFEGRILKLIGLTMLMVVILHGMVDTYFFKNDLAMVFWLIIAIILFPATIKVQAKVVQGLKLGRTIGFPTINLEILHAEGDFNDLSYGIYASRVYVNGKYYKGAMHYGPRPAIKNKKISLEIYLLNFSGDLIGKRVEVEIYNFVRGVMDFPSLENLKERIAKDTVLVENSLL